VNLEIKSRFEKSVIKFAEQHFGSSKKWDAIAERKIYTKEDKSVADQTTGKAPEIVNLYLLVGEHWEYVCEIRENMHRQLGKVAIETGLYRLKDTFESMWKRQNKAGKIHLPMSN